MISLKNIGFKEANAILPIYYEATVSFCFFVLRLFSLFMLVYSPALCTLLATADGQSLQLDTDVVLLFLSALFNFNIFFLLLP